MAFASKVGGSDCFRLKTLNGKYTCGRNYSSSLASSSWVSQKIVINISRGEKMKIATVIQTIQNKYMANISIIKAYWPRRKAREEIHSKLRDYCVEIMRTNPGYISQILIDRPSITHLPRFMRMYMCLDSIKQGFLAGYRPIIGVNGCHLKGDHGQQFLVAVERDPNNNYFPIAVVAVEIETRDSWSWFINLLLDNIGHVNREKWDLMQIFQEIIPALKHRLYLRHLYVNCKKACGGVTVLRDLILSIAKAIYVEKWKRRMTQLMHIN
ncbi:uncharacterized protein LOC130962996 [Arachis stenosperma]|uniref:uncharacterized protein LOC130962996 n=1 Tax=Arachis stenosperma TaxID=217475 RepID=UPI0025AD42ED|nr:uncharacterized protein LOC130962996 [Arachis stenosperma]